MPANLQPHVIARDTGATVARKRNGKSRQAVLRAQERAAGIPGYLSDMSIRRGKCFRCKSRYSVQRVTFDYTSAKAVQPFAHVECAQCGHVWYRTQVPHLREYQSVRLTLILPGDQQRWFARGRWHVQGEDAVVVRDATWSDLMDQSRAWRERNTRYEMSLARAKARREAKAVEAHERAQVLLARLAEMDAARAAEEAAARDRE